MMAKKDILKLEKRRMIYDFIDRNPGLGKREISRRLNIPFSSLSYHLNYLKKLYVIKEKSDGKNIRIFISFKVGAREKDILGLLRNENSCKILLYVIWNYSCSQIELSKELIIPKSTVSYYLNRMLDMELIEEVTSVNGRIYPIPDGEKYLERKPNRSEKFYRRKNNEDSYVIYKLLISHNTSFTNKNIIDYYIDSWKFYKTRRHLITGKKLLLIDDQINYIADAIDTIIRPPFCA